PGGPVAVAASSTPAVAVGTESSRPSPHAASTSAALSATASIRAQLGEGVRFIALSSSHAPACSIAWFVQEMARERSSSYRNRLQITARARLPFNCTWKDFFAPLLYLTVPRVLGPARSHRPGRHLREAELVTGARFRGFRAFPATSQPENRARSHQWLSKPRSRIRPAPRQVQFQPSEW